VPVRDHLLQGVILPGVTSGVDAGSDAEPPGHKLAGLGPAEHPRDRPEISQAGVGLGCSTGRARTDLEPAELLDGRRTQEVLDQLRVLHQRPVGAIDRRRDLLPDLVPTIEHGVRM
jgi:hypothetical protein